MTEPDLPPCPTCVAEVTDISFKFGAQDDPLDLVLVLAPCGHELAGAEAIRAYRKPQ